MRSGCQIDIAKGIDAILTVNRLRSFRLHRDQQQRQKALNET